MLDFFAYFSQLLLQLIEVGGLEISVLEAFSNLSSYLLLETVFNSTNFPFFKTVRLSAGLANRFQIDARSAKRSME
jgi:hypothetical protein